MKRYRVEALFKISVVGYVNAENKEQARAIAELYELENWDTREDETVLIAEGDIVEVEE